MFKVKFEYREDTEYGYPGWIPEAYPMFNAVSGFGLVHDVLEHFPEDDPDLAGELKAFGSMINIRWMSGYWQPYRGFNTHTPEANMAADISRFMEQVFSGQLELKTPPKTYRCDEEVEDMIEGTFRLAVKDYRNELEYSGEEPPTEHDVNILLSKMLGWIRIGYRQSVKRYYGADHYDLTAFFSDIERSVNDVHGDYGDVLEVTVHPRRLEHEVRVISPYYDD